MNTKIRLANIERNPGEAFLFRNRVNDLSIIELVNTWFYHPKFLTEAFPTGISIVAVDIHLPCNVIAFIKELSAKVSPTKILLTCHFVQPDLIFNCLLAGAVGYLEKNSGKYKFEQTLLDCSGGLIHLPLSMSGLLHAEIKISEKRGPQKNILNLLSKGFLLPDVIQETGLSEHQIKHQIFLLLKENQNELKISSGVFRQLFRDNSNYRT